MTTITHPAKVKIDETATFGCSTTLPNPVKWQWMKNGVLVGGSHNAASYQTPPVQTADAGNKYSVTVIGRDGTTETSTQVALVIG